MSNKEIIKKLKDIRMQIALTKDSEERERLIVLASTIHTNLVKNTYNEMIENNKRGR